MQCHGGSSCSSRKLDLAAAGRKQDMVRQHSEMQAQMLIMRLARASMG